MPLINCEVNLILTLSRDCVITNSEGLGKFKITETKPYVPDFLCYLLRVKIRENHIQHIIFQKQK